MAFSTDRLGLNNLALFQKVRENLLDSRSKTRNLMECKDDILFVWNPATDTLLTQNLKALGAGTTSYQTLAPTDPPLFEVDQIRACDSGRQVALFGPRGLAVLDLPRRSGHHGQYQGGKAVVSCRTRTVDERRLAGLAHVEIRQVRWHPGSPSDSHLLVLTSENTFRLYDTSLDGVPLVRVWPLGRAPGGLLTSKARLPLLGGLGETAVDFDFAPPVLGPKNASTPVEWPIMVLRGNGDVYTVSAPISGHSKASVCGPLTMYPPADDNYGADACAVLVLNTAPPLLVVATCAGTLYHCLLLSPEDQDGTRDLGDEEKHKAWQDQPVLHVFESVELELGLSLDNDVMDDASYNCPLQLHRHPTANDRYLVSHEAGIHIIFLPLVSQLENYLEAPDAEADLHVPTFGAETNSMAEYMLCTRVCGQTALGRSSEESSAQSSPMLGLALSPSPATFIALLYGGEVVSLALASLHFPSISSGLLSVDKPTDSMSKRESFDEYIRKILKQGSGQPILKLGKTSPTPQEASELINRVTQHFRERHFPQHDLVHEEIVKRIHRLQALKKQQFDDLALLKEERGSLQAEAERLAEIYEDAKDKQEQLTERAEHVLRLACMKQPVVSSAELQMSHHLSAIQDNVKALKKLLEDARNRWKIQERQINQWKAHQKKREIQIDASQLKTIHENLDIATDKVSTLVKKVQSCKGDLSI